MLEACFFGNGTAIRKSSPLSRLKVKPARDRRRDQHRRRQLLLQQLEPRQLLAADALWQSYPMPSSYQAGDRFAPTVTSPLPYTYSPTDSTALLLSPPAPSSAPPSIPATPVSTLTPPISYPSPASYPPPNSYSPSGAEILLAPPTPGAIDYPSSLPGTPSGAATPSSVATPAVALTQPPDAPPLLPTNNASGSSNTNAYSYNYQSDLSGSILLAPEPPPLDAFPTAVTVSAANATPTNEAAPVSVALEEAGFFGIDTDFGLPELAWWPTSPTSYQPTPIILPGHPDNLPIE
jgi:hypothetical protein